MPFTAYLSALRHESLATKALYPLARQNHIRIRCKLDERQNFIWDQTCTSFHQVSEFRQISYSGQKFVRKLPDFYLILRILWKYQNCGSTKLCTGISRVGRHRNITKQDFLRRSDLGNYRASNAIDVGTSLQPRDRYVFARPPVRRQTPSKIVELAGLSGMGDPLQVPYNGLEEITEEHPLSCLFGLIEVVERSSKAAEVVTLLRRTSKPFRSAEVSFAASHELTTARYKGGTSAPMLRHARELCIWLQRRKLASRVCEPEPGWNYRAHIPKHENGAWSFDAQGWS
nr:hypothetical protein CFP56_73162 [Quercus suber]